jgi:outer membrane protein TolC
MNRFRAITTFAVSLLIAGICCQFGCRPQQPLYLTEKGRWQSHYLDKATKIEFPNVDLPSLPEVCQTTAPLTLDNPDPAAMWDVTLEEAIQMALKNSKVIRTLSGVGFSQAGVSGVPSALLQSPGSVRTVYDPALAESDPRTGPEAALSAFDAQLNMGSRWTKSDTPYRYGNGTAGVQGDVGQFDIGISKYAATGTQFYINHVDQYNVGGAGSTPVTWSSYLEGGFRHRLLQGGGVEFNRIAGPTGTPGMYSGVAVARINTDMALSDFEMATRNLVADVERVYWNLYYAYRRLDSVRAGRDAALQTWRQTKTHADVGSARGRAYQLAQAEQNYFTFRQQTELAQNNLFKAESAMRYILGLTVSDGRLIRPIDDPITAPIQLDWHNVQCEALFRSPELRKLKWTVKQRELELTASKNFLLPQLDLDAGYRISGAGKDLLVPDNSRSNAYGSLTGGNYTGWSVGLTASAPFGWRRELAGVRNAKLNLTKHIALLHEQEVELTHQLADSFREISSAYQQMQTTYASYLAATEEVRAVQNAYEAETITLDQLLQAHRRRSEAETGYYSSVVDYNLSIMTLHYRKGSLLEFNNVCLSEGEWPAKAYFDAKRRARERDAGHYFNYGYTLPGIVSRGAYRQHQHGYNSTAYDILPTVLPGEDIYDTTPPPAPSTNGILKVIDTDSTTTVIPTPVLPKPGGTAPVSFTTPDVATPTSTLTPSRNMRYVQ